MRVDARVDDRDHDSRVTGPARPRVEEAGVAYTHWYCRSSWKYGSFGVSAMCPPGAGAADAVPGSAQPSSAAAKSARAANRAATAGRPTPEASASAGAGHDASDGDSFR